MTDSIVMRNVDLIDGLRRFQDDFLRDFNFRDIRPDLDGHLDKKELLEISNMTDQAQKVDKLFFTFIYVKGDVTHLVKLLKHSYHWLYEAIVKSTISRDKWIEDYRQAIQDIPNNQDWNVHRTQLLWDIQLHLKSLQRNQVLILFGKLGFGKRWLAA